MAVIKGSLKNASLDRLACLLRHWAWADGLQRAHRGNASV